MKHFTLDGIRKLVESGPALPIRPPQPFPGRRYPTRVAWKITRLVLLSSDPPKVGVLTLSYIGKPNRFRALQALKFMRQSSPKKFSWQAEFDRGGLIAYNEVRTQAFLAYHPNAGQGSLIEIHTSELFPKRIGGLTVYSRQKRLSTEQIEHFYAWYEGTFKKKLKRPRTKAMAQSGGPLEEEAEV